MGEVFATLQAERRTLTAVKTHNPTSLRSADRLPSLAGVRHCAVSVREVK